MTPTLRFQGSRSRSYEWLGCLALASLAVACDGGLDAGAADALGMGPADAGPTADADPGPAVAGMLPGTNQPYAIRRGRGPLAGQGVTFEAFMADLAASDAVCMGEQHSSPEDHAFQTVVFSQLNAIAGAQPLGLGMEMVQRIFQDVLDEFGRAAITEDTMLRRVEWQTRWRWPYEGYRPTIELARQAGRPLRALNAERELTSLVSAGGLDALTPAQRAMLPELDLTNEAHKEWFRAAIGDAPGHERPFDTVYAIQVIWDETMADSAWRYLSAAGPGARIAILAGYGHCIQYGIPDRLVRRGARRVTSFRVVTAGPIDEQDALRQGLTDYLVIF